MIDLFYDHFLALHWRDYHEQPLEEFAAEVYALWSARATRISPRLDELLPLMQSQDWLTSYRSLDAIATALDRMALRRLTRPNPLAGSGGELKADYPKFEQDFRVFFSAAQAYSADLRHRERRGALAA
jgi:acyl carrier protein phosphodiesterase